MSRDRARWIVWGAFGAIVAATWWDPPYPAEQALHHGLTVVAVVVLLVLQRRGLVPVRSLILVLLFLTLHTIAARWIYSYVPYDDWLQRLFGVRLSDALGWRRNQFDRLVHFSYGACLAPVLFTYFTGRRGWRPGWAALAAVDIVISTGAIYELLEWGVAATLAPAAAEAYNGQQGDIFDAQKDMALAAAGAVTAMAVVLLVRALRRDRGGDPRAHSADTVAAPPRGDGTPS